MPAIVRWLAVLTLFQAGDLKSLRKQEVHALTSITAGERARLCAHLVGAVWAVSYEPTARQQLLKEGGVQVLLVHALVGDELGLCISAQRISISARDERHLRGGAGRLHSPQTTIATGG